VHIIKLTIELFKIFF